jgi:lipoprotein-releasing system ATP-binding protein
MSNFIIQCMDVCKSFIDAKSELKILSNINFKVRQGEQIAIMGRSGSGKTTLLQILGVLDLPTSGDIFIGNRNCKKLDEEQLANLRNQDLGFIYQFHHLLPEFTAEENVAMPLLIAGMDVSQAKKLSLEILEYVGLLNRKSHKPSELSGGERQRVAIARALVTKPKCVLADEPTGNLDCETAAATFALMQKLNRELNTSFIIVTHDYELASRLDKQYLIKDGELAEFSATQS